MSDAPASAPATSSAPAAPAAQPSAPARVNNADKVAAAKAAARSIPVPGANKRAESRRAASAAVDKHEIARTMAASRAAKAAGAPTVHADDVEIALTPNGQVRDQRTGRFAPKSPETQQAEPLNPAASEQQTDAAGTPETEAEVPAAAREKISALEAQYADADRKLREGSALANERIADITGERDFYKTVLEKFRQSVRARFKMDIDPIAFEREQARLEIAKLKRGAGLVQQREHEQVVQQTSSQLSTRFQAIIGAHPELDPKTNPDAKSFWEMVTGGNLPKGSPVPSLAGLEQDAAAWAMVQRGRKAQALAAAQQAAKPVAPVAKPRPSGMIPRGGAGSEGTTAGAPIAGQKRGAHVSNKAIADHMERFRAIKGGRAS